MNFTPSQLIKIGRLFCDEAHHLDTFDIAKVMRCTEGEIYNALAAAREAYREDSEGPPVDRKPQKAEAITRWTERNKAVNAELRREARG